MDQRLASILERVGQADRALRDRGDDPDQFLLIATGGGNEILHPGWDDSWASPTASDIDDLEELGHVRVNRSKGLQRDFAITVAGRSQAAVLTDKRVPASGGRAPSIEHVLEWLLEQEREAPENLESPARLIPAAVSSNLINESGREPLASRILDLRSQGYLDGFVPRIDQASAEQLLGMCSDGLRLTMKSHDHAKNTNGGNTVNFHGSVVAGQIAAGDITNYVSFGDLLDRAAEEIADLEGIEEDERADATRLVGVLRGKGLDAGSGVLTGAGGGLLATVLAQLLGLTPPA